MGIRVPVDDEAGFDRLLVLGVRASLDPAEAAARLARCSLRTASRTASAFLPPARRRTTPTAPAARWARPARRRRSCSNCERARSRRRRQQAARSPRAPSGSNPSASPGRARRAGGDANDARHMRIALWPATMGYFLEDDAGAAPRRRRCRRRARPVRRTTSADSGRCRRCASAAQPYGLLPATSLTRWRPRRRDVRAARRIVGLLRLLAPEWLARARAGAVRRPARRPAREHARSGAAGDPRPRRALAELLPSAASAALLSPAPPDHCSVASTRPAPTSRRAAFSLFDRPAVQVRLRGCEFDPRVARLRRPLVQHDAALGD